MPFLLTSDSFIRPDSTTDLGSTNGVGVRDPLLWVQQSLQWGILNNTAYTPGGPAAQFPIATVDPGASDVDIKFTWVAGANQAGIIFRFVNFNNYWQFLNWRTSPGYFLFKKVAGAVTNVASAVGAGSPGSILEVKAVGSSIQCIDSGILKLSAISTDLMTATKHGLFTQNEFPPPSNDSSIRFGSFSISTDFIPPAPFSNSGVASTDNLILATTFPIQTTQGPNLSIYKKIPFLNPVSFQSLFPISTNTSIPIPPTTTSITVVPNPINTIPITLKGLAGDTGIKLAVNQPTAFCVDVTATSFILNASSPITVQITFL